MKTLLTLCFTVLFISFGSSQVVCLQDAWNSYNSKNWSDAIEQAEACTNQFGPRARNIQRDLEAQGYTFPCEFTVPNDCTPQQKNEIFARGLLNDVSTSYWIIGMCNLNLGNKEMAIIAFEKARELTFGLCFNSEDELFWSPSQEAVLQLGELN